MGRACVDADVGLQQSTAAEHRGGSSRVRHPRAGTESLRGTPRRLPGIRGDGRQPTSGPRGHPSVAAEPKPEGAEVPHAGTAAVQEESRRPRTTGQQGRTLGGLGVRRWPCANQV